MTKRANTNGSHPKRKLPRTAWKKGQASPNPTGRPKTGESWAELIKKIGDMTPAEGAKSCKAIMGQLASIGNSVTLKEAVVMRVYASLLFEPQPGLFNSFMERTEGKVADKLELLDWRRALTEKGADADLTFQEVIEKITPKLLSSPSVIDLPQHAALQQAEKTDASSEY